MRQKCEKWFREFIETEQIVPTELKHAVRRQERLPVFINRVALQMQQANQIVYRRRGKSLDEKTLKHFMFDMCRMFVNNVEKMKEKEFMSDLEKSRIKQEQDYLKDLDSTAKGKPSGVFEDMIQSTEDKTEELK